MSVEKHHVLKHLTSLELYPDHSDRFESAEFRHAKEQFHKQHAKCFIDNEYCEGHIEIHHMIIEWAESNAVDWDKVKEFYPKVDDVDDTEQLVPICTLHHRKPLTGIHYLPYNQWILQKFYTKEYLDEYMKLVNEALEQKE